MNNFDGKESKAYSVHGPAIYINNLVVTKDSVNSFISLIDRLSELEEKHITVNLNLKDLQKDLKRNFKNKKITR